MKNETPLVVAAKEDKRSVLGLLIEHGEEMERKDEDGFTAMHHCCRTGESENLKKMIKRGADLSTKNRLRVSPLITSISLGHTEVVKVLMEGGIDQRKERGMFGVSPLAVASFGGFLDIVKILLASYSDGSDLDCDVLVAINSSKSQGHLHIVEYLSSFSFFSLFTLDSLLFFSSFCCCFH